MDWTIAERIYEPQLIRKTCGVFGEKRWGASSRFRGVSWDKDYDKWRAGIRVSGKLIHLGRFLDEEDAAEAYNEAARKLFGEFASLI